MRSYEVMREAADRIGVKALAAELRLSPALVYKWCQESSEKDPDSSGARNPLDRVAEIARATGDTCVVAWLCREVITIERHERLAAQARERLAALGVTNVRVEVGDGTLGFPPAQPYDGIMVTAGAPRVPEPLRDQLADGGRLVIPVGGTSFQELVVETKRGERFASEIRNGCIFVPLVGRYGHPG